ncbi:pre-mRNA-splicing factor 18 [Sporothrix brasiliensis 5110]|uniref:Pre-mRNA-splicing factor 18 n=1 Tax=Sporothrix brasiliensis 5110 TaxID=1398154 RepID=A0A0C2J7W0_9PEZI|nr:pre-mRNA-splicing factor 18 [Sporothrix brasiliensis 5110]KIH93092.1 pre-mRNA-splicing factor 18 [Sporothrix brasiliensis 5110]
MDFASLMSAQMAKKKKQLGIPEAGTDGDKSDAPPPKKFVRNSELEAQRKAAYLEAQKAREAEKSAKAAAKRQREDEAAEEARLREEKRRRLAAESRERREKREAEEEAARRKRLGLPELPPPGARDGGKEDEKEDSEDADDEKDMDEGELRAALIKLDAPIILFGENHAQRLRRYRQTAAAVAAALTTTEAAKLPVPTTLAPVPEKDMKVPAVADIPRDKKGRQYLYRQLASYFNLVLREWQQALQEASTKNDGETDASRSARSIMEQSRASIKPLFRRLENGSIDDKIVPAIVEIVHAAQERRYVDANDAYLRLSIGKAAWPIGVIMVGIHERSAREKLHGGDKGSVMTDDVTRKYVQSIKRCLTFAQVRWPPHDASQLMG